ncbi:hypothetical protein BD410DRAFT_795645 [Rickenella mellea]|uniref:Uncharacterized protein n=1 Tax=Rickenella mellea TaxID=50990 RepID=A0A4Y7PL27_9AGAM|nr:hypothetical protein BD410DRAFT_795645 [Rickenella mellea]
MPRPGSAKRSLRPLPFRAYEAERVHNQNCGAYHISYYSTCFSFEPLPAVHRTLNCSDAPRIYPNVLTDPGHQLLYPTWPRDFGEKDVVYPASPHIHLRPPHPRNVVAQSQPGTITKTRCTVPIHNGRLGRTTDMGHAAIAPEVCTVMATTGMMDTVDMNRAFR